MKMTNTPSIQYINKLYYGEYAYSCVVDLYEFHLINGRNPIMSRYSCKLYLEHDTIEDAMENWEWTMNTRTKPYFETIYKRKDTYYNFIKWLDQYEMDYSRYEPAVRIRTESSKLSLYFRDEATFEDFLRTFADNVLSISRPISEVRANYIRNNPKDSNNSDS